MAENDDKTIHPDHDLDYTGEGGDGQEKRIDPKVAG